MLPAPAAKRPPPLLWAPAEPPAPPWAWVVPAAAGLVRVGAAAAATGAPPAPPPPPPLLLPAPPPAPPPAALLRAAPGWRVPCEPLLPLLAAADQHGAALLHGQWIFGAHSPVIGFSPSNVEFVPVFPPVYTSTIPPHAGKNWIDKRLPNCKIYLNNAFALDSAWIHPEESRLFQGNEKPLLMTNQVAMAIARPAAASRPLPTVVLAPQLIPGGCQNSLKPVGGNQTLALAAAATTAMVAVEPEAPQGPSVPSVQPCHVLTFSPIKIPVLASPFPGSASRVDAHMGPLMPTQFTRVTAVAAPAVTFMATNLMDQTLTDNDKESSRSSCPQTLILHTERKSTPVDSDGDKDHSFKLVDEAVSTSNGNKPVASTPVPGSPWCVVWTGDDRVFFFNPTMQLSVWEKPVDLKHRGDINRIIEDPPHKRKLEAAATEKCVSSCPGDENDDLSIKTKRNKTEDSQAAGRGRNEAEEKNEETSAPQITPPLEERITHFRDMLLERGVSAFSTWEKELHKIVFDPRYLLLNSEERKQIFEQFVKTRIREEYKEKKNKLLLAKEEFKKLLEESKLSPRTTFKEFAEKYGRDQRFRLVQKKKDQEHFFNQFILILKKRDKENRIRLRKMR
ncbi:transcription elongation regulator 1-like protein [Falco rusticolus]|uniref:transcription elongation regulator 1-like protein n=1 Tax=Falco rusticolus TaxID=120794 RepID=UPI001886690D|nr:transcription elongation regulator 1-like protein [Falco rusticolus]XP_055577286.1 transcription elongation regulator 1-like protein [Falco cherrug]